MRDRHDDYEPIIAGRRSREPRREQGPPLWRTVLPVVAVFAVVILVAWWWTSRPPSDEGATNAQQEPAAPETFPETHVEQEVVPPARDPGAPAEPTQQQARPAPAPEPVVPAESEAAPTPEATAQSAPEVVPESDAAPPAPPTSVAVRFTSPDSQVRFELRRAPDQAPFLTSKAGDTVEVPPGTYRVTASGSQLERFERDVTFEGDRTLEYAVELCAQRKYDRESLVGQLVEERKCSSAAECQTLFAILSEYADELVRQREFRMEQCVKRRAGATPDGQWTLNIECDGAMPETTCGIEIAEGECTHAQPPRSMRGGTCPRGEIK